MTEASSPEASESPAVGGDAWDLVGGCGEGGGALLEYKLVLMNKQEEVMVGLAHVPARRYSPGTKITTVGERRGCAPSPTNASSSPAHMPVPSCWQASRPTPHARSSPRPRPPRAHWQALIRPSPLPRQQGQH